MENFNPAHISVIIPHYNDLEALKLCVALLDQQTLPREQFEIVVADNNSACGIDAVIEAVPSARVVPAPIQGAGPARNAAVTASSGQILAFTDSDCRPHADWLERGVAALAGCDLLGGQVIVVPEVAGSPTGIEAFDMIFAFNNREFVAEKNFAITANLFARRAVFERSGAFRSTVSEDVEWCQRAVSNGFRIAYADDAIIEHPARNTWPALAKQWTRMMREEYALLSPHRFGKPKLLLKALAMPLSVLPHGVRMLKSHRLPTLQAKLGGIVTLARLRLLRMRVMVSLVLCGKV